MRIAGGVRVFRADAGRVDHGEGGSRRQHMVEFSLGLAHVCRHEHPTRQPDAEHGQNELGPVGQLDDHRLVGFETFGA